MTDRTKKMTPEELQDACYNIASRVTTYALLLERCATMLSDVDEHCFLPFNNMDEWRRTTLQSEVQSVLDHLAEHGVHPRNRERSPSESKPRWVIEDEPDATEGR